MAENTIRNNYKDIADAIRAKKGTSNLMTPEEMVQEITDIVKPTGTLSISENGTGIDVAEYATVDVDIQGGGLTPPELLAPTMAGALAVYDKADNTLTTLPIYDCKTVYFQNGFINYEIEGTHPDNYDVLETGKVYLINGGSDAPSEVSFPESSGWYYYDGYGEFSGLDFDSDYWYRLDDSGSVRDSYGFTSGDLITFDSEGNVNSQDTIEEESTLYYATQVGHGYPGLLPAQFYDSEHGGYQNIVLNRMEINDSVTMEITDQFDNTTTYTLTRIS